MKGTKERVKKFNEEIHRRKQDKNQNKKKSSRGAKEIRSLAKFRFVGIWNSDIDKIVMKRTSYHQVFLLFLSVMFTLWTLWTLWDGVLEARQSQIKILFTHDPDLSFRQRDRVGNESEGYLYCFKQICRGDG